MDDKHYRQLGGVLDNVLQTIRGIHERGIWLEVLTLVIPGFNDSEDELRRAAAFVASVSRDIPWHVTAFHPDYKMTDRGATPVAKLVRAAEIGTEEGLRYVYAGNLPGRVGKWENTRCPSCSATVIERWGFEVIANRLAAPVPIAGPSWPMGSKLEDDRLRYLAVVTAGLGSRT
jgi:pyruvate formate lyase activating enzyme